MPQPPLDEPHRRVTFNIYQSDIEWLRRTYGHGWTGKMREWVHTEILRRQRLHQQTKIEDPFVDYPFRQRQEVDDE